MKSKRPVKEENKPFSCRCLYKMSCYLYVNKGNGEGISFSFQMQGQDERLNMNYTSTSDLYPQRLKESYCAFKETDDINA